MESIHWFLLTLAMAVLSLGMSGIIKAIGVLAAFLAGGICLIYGLSKSSQLSQKANLWLCRRIDEKEICAWAALAWRAGASVLIMMVLMMVMMIMMVLMVLIFDICIYYCEVSVSLNYFEGRRGQSRTTFEKCF